MTILLQTQRLILRSFKEQDWEYLYQLDNDPDVMRYINGGTPTSEEIIRRDILPLFTSYNQELPGIGFWAVIEKSSEQFVGWFCLRLSRSQASEASIGYRFIKSAWGNGYATEGSEALLELGFSQLQLQRIIATTYEYNVASRRVMEKLGMSLARRFEVDLSDQETAHFETMEVWEGQDVEYEILRSDFLKTNKSNYGDSIKVRNETS